jgi:EmrB/QacA subfamily drug resistance transporter
MSESSTYGPAGPAVTAAPTGRAWLVLALLCTAQFMLILDITVVNVALPSIQRDIDLAIADLQWVVTAYTLSFGGLILLGGRAGDLLGRRRTFIAGLVLFTLASLGAALAASPGALIAARGAQGVGAALLSPSALALVTTTFPEGRARHRALAVWAAVAASGGAVGVLLGGVLTQAFGWQAIFIVNAPVGAALAAGVLRLVPAVQPVARGRLDVAGAVLATGSLVALSYGLVGASSAGWTSGRTLSMLALATAGLATFVAVERRVRDPLVPLSIFRRRPTVTALVLMVFGMGPVFSGFFFSSLYLQQVLGHSALRTGVEFLPVAVAIVAAAHVGGQLVSRLGAKPVITAGLALGSVGALLLGRLSPDGTYLTDLLPGFLTLGAGGGLAAAGVMITAMSGSGDHDAGLVSGLTNTAHELSIALTLPLLTTVAATGMGGAVIEAGTEPARLAEGIGVAFIATAVIALAGAIIAATVLRRGDVAVGTQHLHLAH